MDEDEPVSPAIEAEARRLYRLALVDGNVQTPWEAAPEFVRNVWRSLAAGNAGSAVD